MSQSVLIVDDDPDIQVFLRSLLVSAGYRVAVASDGVEGLDRALEMRPDLILADVMMPNMDGFAFAEQIRKDPRTSSTSIIMVTARAQLSDKVLGLVSGADDYIIKPFDPVELLARISGTMRRAREMRAASPLTGLPGNLRIQEEIQQRVQDGKPFALLYADLDHFKAYNDRYGFQRGDQAIQLLATVASRLVHDVAGREAFVGHVGGDDFVMVVSPEVAEQLARELCRTFDLEVPSLYDPDDVERGRIEVRDRRGRLAHFPLLSVSIGVAGNGHHAFSHHSEAVALATEMKHLAKREPGSSFAVDRREA
jgi:PleD family two-component response regulator